MIDDSLRQIFGYINAHLLSEVVLCISDACREYLLAQQYDADDGKYVCSLAPHEGMARDEGIDGIHGAVEHYGIDLRDERTDDCQYECKYHQPAIGLDLRTYLAEERYQIHRRVVL